MAYDTDVFRARYRSGIHPAYSSVLHGSFVFLYGAAWAAFYALRVDTPRLWEWVAVPLAVLFFNWGEYTVHKGFGHTKHPLGKLFYARHTGDHHSFFVEARMSYEEPRDFRVILFPAWLVVVYSLFLTVPVYLLLSLASPNAGALAAATLMLSYLTYELLHTTQHLPDTNPLTKLPWIRRMRRHHALHHRRGLMTEKNFNLVFPLMDVLKGTLHEEPRR